MELENKVKYCYKCNSLKSKEDFGRNASRKDGLCSECKCCVRTYREKNKEYYRQHGKKYRERNPDYFRQHQKEYKIKNKEKIYEQRSNYGFLKRYGITKEQRNNIFKFQNKCCSICKNIIDLNEVCVDHNHITGKMRGLLCKNCNTGLGMFKDNCDFLKNAIEYLNHYQQIDNV